VLLSVNTCRPREGKLTQCALPSQSMYPGTRYGALSSRFAAHERTAHAASARQAIALLRWYHMFGPAEHVKHAELFLLDRMRLMLTVRAPWSHVH
jgi:hypothetical protein